MTVQSSVLKKVSCVMCHTKMYQVVLYSSRLACWQYSHSHKHASTLECTHRSLAHGDSFVSSCVWSDSPKSPMSSNSCQPDSPSLCACCHSLGVPQVYFKYSLRMLTIFSPMPSTLARMTIIGPVTAHRMLAYGDAAAAAPVHDTCILQETACV